jgi:hypothetical protein
VRTTKVYFSVVYSRTQVPVLLADFTQKGFQVKGFLQCSLRVTTKVYFSVVYSRTQVPLPLQGISVLPHGSSVNSYREFLSVLLSYSYSGAPPPYNHSRRLIPSVETPHQ